ncbi:MAG: hypothetical protein ACE5E6_09345 [Phycisphaerae bacterium]
MTTDIVHASATSRFVDGGRRVCRGRRAAVTIGLVLSVACATGCSDPLTYKNFSKIRRHETTRGQVLRRIGRATDELRDDVWVYRRPERQLWAIVTFDEQGRVMQTQWVDPHGHTDMGVSRQDFGRSMSPIKRTPGPDR